MNSLRAQIWDAWLAKLAADKKLEPAHVEALLKACQDGTVLNRDALRAAVSGLKTEKA